MMLEHKQQPGERIATYTQRFRLIARDARDMAELDRIEHYMNGLAAQFQAVCRTDSEGKDWTSLDSLVSYALGQESRKTQSKGATLAIANTSRPPFRSRPRKQGCSTGGGGGGGGGGYGGKRPGGGARDSGKPKKIRADRNTCRHCFEHFANGFPAQHLQDCAVLKRKKAMAA